MLTSILLFVGGLSAGVILGSFGGYAASNGVAKLRQTKARTELPDDELYREAYNEVACLTGDVKVVKKPVPILAPLKDQFVSDNTPFAVHQQWKVKGISKLVVITSWDNKPLLPTVTYYSCGIHCNMGAVEFRKIAKIIDA